MPYVIVLKVKYDLTKGQFFFSYKSFFSPTILVKPEKTRAEKFAFTVVVLPSSRGQ